LPEGCKGLNMKFEKSWSVQCTHWSDNCDGADNVVIRKEPVHAPQGAVYTL
jgi:hypothetical protein